MADQEVSAKISVEDASAQSGLAAVVSALKNSVGQMMGKLGELGAASTEIASKISLSNEKIAASYKSMATQVEAAHTQVTGFFNKMQGAVNALTAIIAGGAIAHFVIELGKSAADYAEEIFRASEKTGIATEKLQELKAVAELNEVSFRALQIGLQRMALQMTQAQQGSARAVDNFKRLGISVQELKNMKMDDVLARMADKFNETANSGAKLALSQQMLGRAGREFVPLLNLGSEGLKEQIKLVHDLGIVMDEESLVKARNLKEELKQLHLVNEGLTRQISMALVPAFTQIAVAMINSRKEGGELKSMVSGLGEFLKSLTSVGSWVIEVFEGIGTALGGLGAIYAAVIARDFGRVKTTIRDFFSDTSIHDKWSKFRADLEKPINLPPIKDKPELEAGTGGKHAKDTRMAEWKEELAERQEAMGPFREMEKAEEIAFWEEKLALIKGMGDKEVALRRQVMQIIRNDKKAAAREEQALDVKRIEDQISAQRFNLDAQIKLTHTLAEFQKATWGESSKQYEAALAKETALKEKQIEQLEHLEKMRADLHLKYDLQEIAIDEEMMHRAVDLRQMSSDQQLQVEANLENRRYALITATLARERAAIEADQLLGDTEREMKLIELDHKLESVESQHQATLTRITTAAEKERQQIAIDAANIIQNNFASLIENLIMNTKNWKQSFLDAAKAVEGELVRLAANDLAKKWFGAGTEGGSMLTGFFGKVFGTGAVGSTGAATADAAMTTLGTTVTSTVDPAMLALTAAANQAAAALLSVGTSGAGGLGGALTSGGFDAIAGYAIGTPYVPRDTLAYVHKGEAIIPAQYNVGGSSRHSNIGIHNSFNFSGPVDSRTMTQMAIISHRSAEFALRRSR